MTLEIRNLRVRYGRMLALSDVSLTVRPGVITAMVGPNGAGKSTTLRAISGLISPESGSITYEGKSLLALPAHAISRLGIAHVPEGRGMLPALTVAENLRLGAFGRPDPGKLEADRERILGFFPALRQRMNEHASVLSGGEQQMLSLARAMLKAPKVLMVDEMSLGLAPKLTQQLMEVVVEFARTGHAVLCVEQNTKLVLRHADYAYVLETGRTVLEGKGSALLNDGSVVKSYLGTAAVDGRPA